MAGVLEGVRVLDMGRYIAGPLCSALLGDLGAEVIRIERVGGGEDRTQFPTGGDSGANYGAVWSLLLWHLATMSASVSR